MGEATMGPAIGRREEAWRGQAYGRMVGGANARNAAVNEARSCIPVPVNMLACVEDMVKILYPAALPAVSQRIGMEGWVDSPGGVPIGMHR